MKFFFAKKFLENNFQKWLKPLGWLKQQAIIEIMNKINVTIHSYKYLKWKTKRQPFGFLHMGCKSYRNESVQLTAGMWKTEILSANCSQVCLLGCHVVRSSYQTFMDINEIIGAVNLVACKQNGKGIACYTLSFIVMEKGEVR